MTLPRATSTVIYLSDHRAVWLLPDRGGVLVSIVARGFPVRVSRERWFAPDQYAAAIDYADQLGADTQSAVFNCAGDLSGGREALDA